MAVAEPSGQLWQQVGPMIGGWLDSNEDQLATAADGRDAAAVSARTAMTGAQQSAAATQAAWQDPAGAAWAAALDAPTRTAQKMGDEFGRLAGQTRTFADNLRATKSTIAETIAVNEPLYQMALAVPGGAAGDLAAAVAGHLNRVIDQAAGQLAGGGGSTFAAQPPPGPGAADVTTARDVFFGPPPPGVARQIIQTDAIIPGGQDGVIVSRFFIADEKAAFGYLYGDGRGPTTDPNASNRFSVAWDTRTGEVSLSVQPSDIDLVTAFGGGVPLPIEPTRESSVYTTPALPITVGPGGAPNNFVVNRADAGGIDVSYSVLNSGDPVNNVLPDLIGTIGEANGRVQISLPPDQINLTNVGDDYPDGEFIQYRDSGTRLLGNKEMSPLKELSPVGSDIVPDFGQGSYLENIPR